MNNPMLHLFDRWVNDQNVPVVFDLVQAPVHFYSLERLKIWNNGSIELRKLWFEDLEK